MSGKKLSFYKKYIPLKGLLVQAYKFLLFNQANLVFKLLKYSSGFKQRRLIEFLGFWLPLLFKMNYLAHAILSFNDPAILTGNMISDFVKGKKQFEYPAAIHKGIVLHRNIDSFTDAHPATAKIKKVFHQDYRLYSGAFADVAYDHFLANDKNEFPMAGSLQEFSQTVYAVLANNKTILPERFAMMLPYMIEQDWLNNYQFRWGMQKSFAGLVRRAKYISESDRAFELFNQHYDLLQECYNDFFPAIKNFAAHQLAQLKNT